MGEQWVREGGGVYGGQGADIRRFVEYTRNQEEIRKMKYEYMMWKQWFKENRRGGINWRQRLKTNVRHIRKVKEVSKIKKGEIGEKKQRRENRKKRLTIGLE